MAHPALPFLSRRHLLAGAAALAAAPLLGGLETTGASAQSRVADPTALPQTAIGNPLQLAPAFVQQAIAVTDAGATLQRTFLVHVPPRQPGQPPLPAVIVFHGGGQQASAMVDHWQSMVPAGNMVIVCPQALVDPATNATRWIQARPGDIAVPTTDLAFVDALLGWLAARGDVDMERVYASGFSSGAGMTWQLTVLNQFVNRFRGFAPVSKTISSAQLALADAAARSTPRPLIYVHGSADDNWSQIILNEPQPTPPDVVADWISRNRTLRADQPVVYSCVTERPLDPFAVEQLYRPNPAVVGSAAICFLTIVNGSHCWPLTGSDPTGRGLVCRDIDATKRIVSFWNTYAGMGLPASPFWRVC